LVDSDDSATCATTAEEMTMITINDLAIIITACANYFVEDIVVRKW
jgi:hypothetical protein